MDVISEAQLDLPGSKRTWTGSLVFPQQEGLYPNPASSRTDGLLSPAGGTVTSNKPPRSPRCCVPGTSQLSLFSA